MSDDQVPLLASVDRTVAALATVDADAALVHLVQLYAAEIDGAAAWRDRADRHARRVREQLGDESALYEETAALAAALSQRSALLAVGKALHAALVELTASPKARSAGAPKRPTAGASTLAGLRAAQVPA